MPIKKDAADNRWVELELAVPGTQVQAWHAVATGAGMSAWFTSTTVEERVGGAIAFDFGDGNTSSGTVTAWQPPMRFAYEERDWSGDAPPVATDVVVAPRPGGGCLVRMIHRLTTPRDDWDAQLEGFEAGWPGFFAVLRAYLDHFPDQPAAAVRATAMCAAGDLEAWSKMTEALGLAGANVGERCTAPDGAPRMAGVVGWIQQDDKSRSVMIRLAQPGDGIALIGSYPLDEGGQGAVSIYFYGKGAARNADAVRTEWTSWLRHMFATSQGA